MTYYVFTTARIAFRADDVRLKLGGIEISIPVTVFLKYRGIPKYRLNLLRECV